MGEFKKIKPPIFNGEIETRERWKLGFLECKNTLRQARMTIYNLTEKEDIWWQDMERVKNIKECKITWNTFKRYFKKQYL